MVTPAARREAVDHLEQGYEMSEVGASSKQSSGLFVANNGVFPDRGGSIVSAIRPSPTQ